MRTTFQFDIQIAALTRLRDMITMFSVLKNYQMFSEVAIPFYTATAVAEGSNFSTFSVTLIVHLFYQSHPRGYEAVPHCGLDGHFHNNKEFGLLSRACWTFRHLPWRNV